MITVAEAFSIIQKQVFRPSTERVKIETAEGRVLAESIKADRDLPPFDRVAMDGIAIRHKSFEDGWRDFKIEAIQPAGQPRLTLKDENNCIEVMTGAMLPIGCDTVIRYEDLTISTVNKIAKVKVSQIDAGQSIHPRAQDAKRGDILLEPGALLSAAEIAVLASVGWAEVAVYSSPKIAIVSTGNELVDVHDRPLPHQIRRSNSQALLAALGSMHGGAIQFHLPDDRNVLEKELGKIFQHHEVIILTGGVSKGKFDFVPAAMEALGVQKLFHEVSQKPGKPFWFGASKKQIVFALPGNPVSTFLCFYRYIKPWFAQSLGQSSSFGSAILTEDVTFNLPLTYFLQVKIKNQSGKLLATPRPGGGSGDFANLKEVDGFLELPQDKNVFHAGEPFLYIPFRK